MKFPSMTAGGSANTVFKTRFRRLVFRRIGGYFSGRRHRAGYGAVAAGVRRAGAQVSSMDGRHSAVLFSICMALVEWESALSVRKINPITIMACGMRVIRSSYFLWVRFVLSNLLLLQHACVLASLQAAVCGQPCSGNHSRQISQRWCHHVWCTSSIPETPGGIFMPWVVGVIADHSSLSWGLAISACAVFHAPNRNCAGSKTCCSDETGLVGRSTGAWIVNSAGKHNHTRDLIRHDKKERSINSHFKRRLRHVRTAVSGNTGSEQLLQCLIHSRQ